MAETMTRTDAAGLRERHEADKRRVAAMIAGGANPWAWVHEAQLEVERRVRVVDGVLAEMQPAAVQEAVPAIERVGICEICRGVKPLVNKRCPLCREAETGQKETTVT